MSSSRLNGDEKGEYISPFAAKGPTRDARTQALEKGYSEVVSSQVFLASFAYFILSYLYNMYITFVFNWSTNLLQRPLSSLMSFFTWTFTVVFLTVFAFVLRILNFFGFGKVVLAISHRFYGGNAIPNWGQPDLIHGHSEEVLDGIQAINTKNFNIFHKVIAKSSLILAAAAYERHSQWNKFVKDLENEHVSVLDARHVAITREGNYVRLIFFRIKNTNKVIIALTFKGTSPFELTEWLTDFSLSKTDASTYLWGAVHQGFYSKLFLLTGQYRNAYEDIFLNIRKVIEENDKRLEYTLFNTGHSLGAGLAAVFYARLLKSIDDLKSLVPGANLNYAGAYTFGGPKIGGFNFACEVASERIRPLRGHAPALFTMQNACDFAPFVPLGLGDGQVAFISNNNNPQDYLDYSNIGTIIRLHRFKSDGFIGRTVATTTFLGDATQRRITTFADVFCWLLDVSSIVDFLSMTVDLLLSWAHIFEYKDIMNILSALVPFVGDHMPGRYYTDFDYLDIRDDVEELSPTFELEE